MKLGPVVIFFWFSGLNFGAMGAAFLSRVMGEAPNFVLWFFGICGLVELIGGIVLWVK